MSRRRRGWPAAPRTIPSISPPDCRRTGQGKYYFARFQQRVNRVVDIAPWVERKIDLNLENKAQGPAGENGQRLRARLDAQGQRLPLLGLDDASANRNYIREFVLQQDRITGQRHGLTYAERFHSSVLRRITWRNTSKERHLAVANQPCRNRLTPRSDDDNVVGLPS